MRLRSPVCSFESPTFDGNRLEAQRTDEISAHRQREMVLARTAGRGDGQAQRSKKRRDDLSTYKHQSKRARQLIVRGSIRLHASSQACFTIQAQRIRQHSLSMHSCLSELRCWLVMCRRSELPTLTRWSRSVVNNHRPGPICFDQRTLQLHHREVELLLMEIGIRLDCYRSTEMRFNLFHYFALGSSQGLRNVRRYA